MTNLEKTFWCDEYQQWKCQLNCVLCENFPCTQLSREIVQELHWSPLLTRTIIGIEPSIYRRPKNMFIAKYTDGSMAEIQVDVNDPDLQLLERVVEVYEIKKIYVPKVVLRPKTTEERKQVRDSQTPAEGTSVPEKSAPRRRRAGKKD